MIETMELRAAVARELPGVVEDLTRLVSVRSISAMPEHDADVQASAEAVADLLRGAGCPDVAILAEGGKPAVVGRYPAPEGKPTVCLYAHHDVQPAGDEELWASDPFAASERDGRLYARGVADDKAGVAVHLAVLRAFGGKPPVGVTVFVEGEEESGSPSIGAFLDAHGDKVEADAFVICDSANWAVGSPAFTTTLRGLADVVVRVRTLDHALHSGQYGGVVPDALTTLCKLIGTLWDDDGSVAVAGLHTDRAADLDYPDARLRGETGLLGGVSFIGRGSFVERMWARPTITVLGIDATPVAKASNTLAPSARAKVSMRLAPGQDAAAALAALKDHLRSRAPFGAEVTFGEETAAGGTRVPFEGPIADAAYDALRDSWGTDPVFIGQGGSIPLAAELRARFPKMVLLVTGVVDPDTRMHGIDESLSLDDFEKACVGEALWLQRLGC